jgi:predicted Zn-dependent protease
MDKLIQLLKNKKFKAAETFLSERLEESPDNIYLLTQLAFVLWNRNKDKEAMYYADKAKEISPHVSSFDVYSRKDFVVHGEL